MTTLYKDTARDQLIYVNTYDPNMQSELFICISLTINKYKYHNKGWADKLVDMLQYMDSYFMNNKKPIILLRNINPISLLYLPPLYTWIINTAMENSKNAGITINMDAYSAKIKYYEFEPNGEEYPQFLMNLTEKGNSVLFCITKEEGITECELTVYPHFEEEVSISNVTYDIFTQCSTYNKELHVPLQEGSIVVLSNSTHYSLHHIKGKGKCHIMIVSLYYD